MSVNTETTDLTGQYRAQVDADLGNNAEEQERVTAEIAALQERLTALRHERSVLVNVQQALVAAAPAAPGSSGGATVPTSRKEAPAPSGRGKDAQEEKPAAGNGEPVEKTTTENGEPAGKTTAGNGRPAGRTGTAAEKAPNAEAPASSRPTLVELTRRHLAEQNEPRSAAEITTALAQALPDRGIKATVVRTTLEGLVARSQAQRTRQGRSVFYSRPEA